MNQMFTSLGIGLSIAVCVILVMLTAYFQSPRLALTSIGAVPGVITGVVTALVLTKTTLNIESFMGSIMCIEFSNIGFSFDNLGYGSFKSAICRINKPFSLFH